MEKKKELSDAIVERTYYWHIHHDKLVEGTTDIKKRINYVKKYKPADERNLRIKLMTKVEHPDKLPDKWKKADKRVDEVAKKLDEAAKKLEKINKKRKFRDRLELKEIVKVSVLREWADVNNEFYNMNKKYKIQLEALHKKEHPNCPWDGQSIFKVRVYSRL